MPIGFVAHNDFGNRGTGHVDYAYDALGRRISRDDGTQLTNFTFDGQNILMDDDTVSGIFTYQNGLGTDNKLKISNSTSSSYLLADHLGSSVALTNSAGSVTDQTNYDSFGNATNMSFPSRYQFTGREYDLATGLQYNRARWYDPVIGRFMSEDPIGLAVGDINMYGYVWNSPGRYTDPLGLDGWGNDAADSLDSDIEYARQFYKRDSQYWFWNGSVDTVADLSSGVTDMLRVGNGLGHAIYCEDNAYGKAAYILMDVQRAAGIFSLLAGPGARLAELGGKPTGFNPFEGKTPPEIDRMLRNKGYTTSGPDPLNGKGGYVNPKSTRSYHIDVNNRFGEPPHVDVNRLRTYRGPLPKRKFPM